MNRVLVLTYNPDSHLSDDERVLQRMLDEFRTFGRVFTGWGTNTEKGVEAGTRFVILQQGKYGHGIFAEGFVAGPPVKGVPTQNPSRVRETGAVVPIVVDRLTDPRRGHFIHDADAALRMIGRLDQQGSGYFSNPLGVAV